MISIKKTPDSDIHSLRIGGLSLPQLQIEDSDLSLFQSQNQTSETILGQIGAIGAGGASLPLGQLILAFKHLCPGISQNPTIYGSLQSYGRNVTLTARLEGRNVQTWYVNEKIMTDNFEINISCLVRELSYKIYYDLAKIIKDIP